LLRMKKREASPPHAASIAILRMFRAIVTNDHSPRTAAKPRGRNCRKRSADFDDANTGSTVCLRRA